MLWLHLLACVRIETPFDLQLPAAGIDLVDATMERGDLVYSGSPGATQFDVHGLSVGTGRSKSRAEAHQDDNRWSVENLFTSLAIDTQSDHGRVDLDIQGPDRIDVDAFLGDGTVELYDLEAEQLRADASYITTRAVIGDVDFRSSGGMDVEIWPYNDGTIDLDSNGGNVILALPYGGDYSLEVWGDPSETMTVADLGFRDSYLGEGYFSGLVNAGTIRVIVHVTGGSFQLIESR